MAHFSASGDSIASRVIVVRIGFEPCNNILLQLLLDWRARPFAFVARCCASYHGDLSLDPFFSIVASLKAMQCVKLRTNGRLSYGCVF